MHGERRRQPTGPRRVQGITHGAENSGTHGERTRNNWESARVNARGRYEGHGMHGKRKGTHVTDALMVTLRMAFTSYDLLYSCSLNNLRKVFPFNHGYFSIYYWKRL